MANQFDIRLIFYLIAYTSSGSIFNSFEFSAFNLSHTLIYDCSGKLSIPRSGNRSTVLDFSADGSIIYTQLNTSMNDHIIAFTVCNGAAIQ